MPATHGKKESGMNMEIVNEVMEAIIRGTMTGICLGFIALGLVAIWKWFFGVVKRVVLFLFPGLEAWAQRRREAKHLDEDEEEKQEWMK